MQAMTDDRITLQSPDGARAELSLHGGHLLSWKPAGAPEQLYLSPRSEFTPGKAIRGGVPISFPWFATDSNSARYQSKPGPSHGFARIQPWTLAFAALSGDDLHMTFTLGPTQLSRNMGFDNFALAYQLTLGSALTMRLTVANRGTAPLRFEEALHAYYRVADIHEAILTGLGPTPYIDKIKDFARQPAANAPLTFTGPTDRVYPGTSATCVLHDPVLKRALSIEKMNSNTTVVFNPWKDLPDMTGGQWHEMLAVEAANTGGDAITLAPGESHTMQAHVTVEKSA